MGCQGQAEGSVLEDLHKSLAAGRGAKQGVQHYSSTQGAMEAGVSRPTSSVSAVLSSTSRTCRNVNSARSPMLILPRLQNPLQMHG